MCVCVVCVCAHAHVGGRACAWLQECASVRGVWRPGWLVHTHFEPDVNNVNKATHINIPLMACR